MFTLWMLPWKWNCGSWGHKKKEKKNDFGMFWYANFKRPLTLAPASRARVEVVGVHPVRFVELSQHLPDTTDLTAEEDILIIMSLSSDSSHIIMIEIKGKDEDKRWYRYPKITVLIPLQMVARENRL